MGERLGQANTTARAPRSRALHINRGACRIIAVCTFQFASLALRMTIPSYICSSPSLSTDAVRLSGSGVSGAGSFGRSISDVFSVLESRSVQSLSASLSGLSLPSHISSYASRIFCAGVMTPASSALRRDFFGSSMRPSWPSVISTSRKYTCPDTDDVYCEVQVKLDLIVVNGDRLLPLFRTMGTAAKSVSATCSAS